MNLLKQFQNILDREHRAVAQLKTDKGNDMWLASSVSGGGEVLIKGSGYEQGDTVFYNARNGEILEKAAAVRVVELRV